MTTDDTPGGRLQWEGEAALVARHRDLARRVLSDVLDDVFSTTDLDLVVEVLGGGGARDDGTPVDTPVVTLAIRPQGSPPAYAGGPFETVAVRSTAPEDVHHARWLAAHGVQRLVTMQVWERTGVGGWPLCPRHPHHPLEPVGAVGQGEAESCFWACRASGYRVAIGRLGEGRLSRG